MVLANVVAWSAILACIVTLILGVLNRRDVHQARVRERAAEVQAAYERGRASVTDELAQVRKDRDYWRDIVVRRAERDHDHE